MEPPSKRSRKRRSFQPKTLVAVVPASRPAPVAAISISILVFSALVGIAWSQNEAKPTPIPSASVVADGTAAPSPSPTPEASASPAMAAEKTASAPDAEDVASGNNAGFYLIVVLFLTLLNGAFAMAETALVSVRPSRVEQLVEEQRRGATAVQTLIQNPPRFIATIQIAITLLGFASAAIAATSLSDPVVPLLRRAPVIGEYAEPIAVGVVTLLLAVVSMVLGEIAPKSLALQRPDQWALRLAPMLRFCSMLFTPITALVVGLSNLIVRPFGASAQFETPMITREEFEQIIGQTEMRGEIDDQEAQIMTNVFDLSETAVRAVMTPRIDMTALPVDSPLSQTLETILESGHSRIPVYEGTIDNIVGIVHAKDLLPHFKAAQQNVNLHEVARPAYFIPESRRVSDLLTEMRRSKNQLAIVQDEYAGTEGLVTIEDLLEEIVGDIRDEYDVDEPEIQVLSPTESLIDGRMSIDDVGDRLGLKLSHHDYDDYDTIGGLVFGLLGHEPTPGETVRVEGIEFRVEAMDGGRVQMVRALQEPESAAVEADEDDA